ncbi:MAG: hypothetical protein U9O20_01955 [Patescibacteria group bacterium]|nr:hypothetical protein [Patescibacteria group bacterium]
MYYTGVVLYTLFYSAISPILPKKVRRWMRDYIERLPMSEMRK